MAIFFQPASVHTAEVMKASLEEALRTDPASVREPSSEAQRRVLAIQQQTVVKFSWGRLVVAIALLIGLLVAAIYCAQDDKLQDLYRLLLHSFELILGAVIGLLTGEAMSR